MTCLEGAQWTTGWSKVKWQGPRSWRPARLQRQDSPPTVRYVKVQTSSLCINYQPSSVTNKTWLLVPTTRSWVWARSPVPLQCSHLKMVSSVQPWLKKHTHWLSTPADLLPLKLCPGKYDKIYWLYGAVRFLIRADVKSAFSSQANPNICRDRGWTVWGGWERCGWGRQVSWCQTGCCWDHGR